MFSMIPSYSKIKIFTKCCSWFTLCRKVLRLQSIRGSSQLPSHAMAAARMMLSSALFLLAICLGTPKDLNTQHIALQRNSFTTQPLQLLIFACILNIVSFGTSSTAHFMKNCSITTCTSDQTTILLLRSATAVTLTSSKRF